MERVGGDGTGPLRYLPLSGPQLAVLRGVTFVRLLPDDVEPLVYQLFEPVRIPPRGVLIHQGTRADALYVVVAGELVIVKELPGGDVTVDHVGPGGVVGEVALLEDRLRIATVRAGDGPAEVLRLDRHVVAAVLEVHPEVRAALAAGVQWARVNSLLRGHPAFAQLPVDERTTLLDAFEPLSLRAGEVLEDVSDGLYAVETGRLLLRGGEGEASLDVAELIAGDLVGEGTALDHADVRLRLQAIEEARLFRLPRAVLADRLERDPGFAAAVRARAEQRALRAPDGGEDGLLATTVQRLQIEIDQSRREREVAEIAESDFFTALQARARELRAHVRGAPSSPEGPR